MNTPTALYSLPHLGTVIAPLNNLERDPASKLKIHRPQESMPDAVRVVVTRTKKKALQVLVIACERKKKKKGKGKGKTPEPWKWIDLPGGKLEANETWEAAAIRETLEETGYSIQIVRPLGYVHEIRDTTKKKFVPAYRAQLVQGARKREQQLSDTERQDGYTPLWVPSTELMSRLESATPPPDERFTAARNTVIVQAFLDQLK